MADLSGLPLSAVQFMEDLKQQVRSEVNHDHQEAMRKLRVENYKLKKRIAELEAHGRDKR